MCFFVFFRITFFTLLECKAILNYYNYYSHMFIALHCWSLTVRLVPHHKFFRYNQMGMKRHATTMHNGTQWLIWHWWKIWQMVDSRGSEFSETSEIYWSVMMSQLRLPPAALLDLCCIGHSLQRSAWQIPLQVLTTLVLAGLLRYVFFVLLVWS